MNRYYNINPFSRRYTEQELRETRKRYLAKEEEANGASRTEEREHSQNGPLKAVSGAVMVLVVKGDGPLSLGHIVARVLPDPVPRGAALNEEAAVLFRERGYKRHLEFALNNLGWAAMGINAHCSSPPIWASLLGHSADLSPTLQRHSSP